VATGDQKPGEKAAGEPLAEWERDLLEGEKKADDKAEAKPAEDADKAEEKAPEAPAAEAAAPAEAPAADAEQA